MLPRSLRGGPTSSTDPGPSEGLPAVSAWFPAVRPSRGPSREAGKIVGHQGAPEEPWPTGHPERDCFFQGVGWVEGGHGLLTSPADLCLFPPGSLLIG